ncbi:MAG TPA: hypothetical protein PKG95_12575 [Anaerolineaceae bacterium]|nr:hypothetical protein [Anaerolineaceae bacterium]
MKTYTQGMAGGLLVVGLLVGGCMVVEEPLAIDNLPRARVTAPAEPVLVADPTDPTLARRFTEPDEKPGAVDSALLWSQKYQELSETTERLRQENTRLAEENRTLQQKLATAQLELERTQGELADANRFLQDMHGELTRWKADVLGFREEMRTAQVSQVQALSKILQILGAEPMAGAPTSVASASGSDKTTVSP